MFRVAVRERRRYVALMLTKPLPTKSPIAALDRLLEPVGRCLTPRAARALVALRADEETQNRIEELARKSTAGKLKREERAEYESLVAAGTVIAILQAKARAELAKRN